jgi:hypothetical protein
MRRNHAEDRRRRDAQFQAAKQARSIRELQLSVGAIVVLTGATALFSQLPSLDEWMLSETLLRVMCAVSTIVVVALGLQRRFHWEDDSSGICEMMTALAFFPVGAVAQKGLEMLLRRGHPLTPLVALHSTALTAITIWCGQGVDALPGLEVRRADYQASAFFCCPSSPSGTIAGSVVLALLAYGACYVIVAP